MSFWKLCHAADQVQRLTPPPDLPDGWDSMSVGSLWDALNDPARYATPQATIEAVVYVVRTRGTAALTEPATIERLQRCDDRAKAEINRRIAALEKVAA
jgi:hypothetical protein